MRRHAPQAIAGTLGPLRLLLAAVLVVPIVLFASAAWLDYRHAFGEAWTQLWRATDAVGEHALKVFETNELILDRLAEHVAGMSWDEIGRSEELHTYMEGIGKDVPHVATIGLIAPDLRIVSTNHTFPMPPISARPHLYVPIPREREDELFVSDLFVGNVNHQLQFLVTRHKPNSPRPANGSMIYVSLSPEYFRHYYDAAFGGLGYSVTIARADGAILARYPELPDEKVLSPESGFRRATAVRPQRGTYTTISEIDGRERIFAYRKLGVFPVYVAVGVETRAIVAGWLEQMAGYLVYGVPATLALILITLMALRRTERERQALLKANAEARRREEAEASLHQAQKMEAVGQLTGGVAHDFNNLLTAIIGSLEIILRSDGRDGSVQKYAATAMRAAERGARLTQQLLAFSRRQILRPEVVNANRLLREFETLIRGAIGESLEFSISLDPDLASCRIDPAQFQSAILNLVVNARDATPPGGRIAISTRNTKLTSTDGLVDAEISPGEYVIVSVSDTGRGMTDEVRAHAFDPFFTTKEVGKGSGLGLSQVYGFAKQSGGHVMVDSVPGQGTRVRLLLPRATEPALVAEAKPADAPHAAPPRPATVLIVEDDDAVLTTAQAGLASLGYFTLTARDAGEAIAILRRGTPVDLLFTDIVMPGGTNGVELARAARRLRPDIQVLLTSGYAAASSEGISEGFVVLEKPYHQAQLAATIGRVMAEASR